MNPEIRDRWEAMTVDQKKALIDRVNRCADSLGWRHPFFLPAWAYMRPHVLPVGTMCVTQDGRMFVDPFFAATLSDEELGGVIAHEIMHLIAGHCERGEGLIRAIWGIAADMADNAVLREAKIALPDHAIYPDSDKDSWSAEDLYRHLLSEAQKQPQGGGQGDGQGGDGQGGGAGSDPSLDPVTGKPRVKVCAGCGVDPAPPEDGAGKGDQDSDDQSASGAAGESGEDSGDAQPGMAPGASTWEDHWRHVGVQCAVSSRGRGEGSGDTLARILDTPPARVKWEKVVRHAARAAIAAHGRDDVTYMRRSRRTGASGPIFPGHVSYKASVAIAIDSSGSMSDKDLSEAVTNTVAICREIGIRAYLVVHDHSVQYQGWIKPHCRARDISPKIKGRGGTDFEGAYSAIADAGVAFDSLIHLTDGECYWPDPPVPRNVKRLIVALLGYRERAHCPPIATVIDATINGGKR